MWCPGPELNRYVPFGTRDFKSRASASFATRAGSEVLEKTISVHCPGGRGSLDRDRIVTELGYVPVFAVHLACRFAEIAFTYDVVSVKNTAHLLSRIVIANRSGIPERAVLSCELRSAADRETTSSARQQLRSLLSMRRKNRVQACRSE